MYTGHKKLSEKTDHFKAPIDTARKSCDSYVPSHIMLINMPVWIGLVIFLVKTSKQTSWEPSWTMKLYYVQLEIHSPNLSLLTYDLIKPEYKPEIHVGDQI